jgi:hypothetical protein
LLFIPDDPAYRCLVQADAVTNLLNRVDMHRVCGQRRLHYHFKVTMNSAAGRQERAFPQAGQPVFY